MVEVEAGTIAVAVLGARDGPPVWAGQALALSSGLAPPLLLLVDSSVGAGQTLALSLGLALPLPSSWQLLRALLFLLSSWVAVEGVGTGVKEEEAPVTILLA